MENNFKPGDIVWCTRERKYSVTDYHIPCVVGEVYDSDMDVCVLNDANTENEFFFRVAKYCFEKCDKISTVSKSTNRPGANFYNIGEGEFLISKDYDYKIIQNEDGSATLKCTKTDNTEKIEKWKKATLKRIHDKVDSPKHKKHTFNFYTAGKFGIAIGEFSDGVHTGIARWNGKDKWDANLSQCIAFSRLLGWDIPNFVLK